MDRSLKWRTFALFIGLLLCAGILAPTVAGEGTLPSWFPFKKKINLGLDLQGGVHMVYSIDLGKAVDDRASEIKRDLDSRYTDEKVKATVKTPRVTSEVPIGSVTVSPEDASKHDELQKQIESDFGNTISARDCQPTDPKGSICFRVSTSYADGIKKSALANAVTTIRDRINEKGLAEPSVVEKGDQIIVELPGDPESQVVKDTLDIIARTAKLEFKVVDNNSPYMLAMYKHVGSVGKQGKPTDPMAIKLDVRAEIDQWKPESGPAGMQYDYYLVAYDTEETHPIAWAEKHGCLKAKEHAESNGQRTCPITGRQIIERYLYGDPDLGVPALTADPAFKIPDDKQISFEMVEPMPDAKDKRMSWRSYYLDRAVRLTGSAISNASPNQDPNTGHPVVILDFNRYGGRVFGDVTAQIVGKKLATILDDKVKSAPIINTEIRGGRATITMGGSDVVRQEKEREDLVNVLKTGSLPAPLTIDARDVVGPTLGSDAIDKTKLSFIIGIILVIMIMVGIYKWSGTIAVFAVVFHIVMTLAVMAAFGATLTLPGIAAIVLSIGMEVDGNILIYERIRDELLLGKSVRGAVDLGFSRAFSAILDGQLTTAAAGWVLLQYGSGPIKGFAVMLLVGVFTTLSTNIWVTRIFFDWYISRKKGQLATISI